MKKTFKITPELVFSCYLIGVFLTWAYLVAYGMAYHEGEIADVLLIGWIISLFWPLFVAVWAMSWLFF